MKLRAKQNKSKYKDTNSWLNAVYRNNKEYIDNKLSNTWGVKSGKYTPKSTFKQLVKEYMQDGLSPKKALDTLSKTTIFVEVGERLRSNAYQGIVSDKEAFKQFRELTKEKGKYTKIDMSLFEYDKKDKTYIYNKTIGIRFDNSPFEIKIWSI